MLVLVLDFHGVQQLLNGVEYLKNVNVDNNINIKGCLPNGRIKMITDRKYITHKKQEKGIHNIR